MPRVSVIMSVFKEPIEWLHESIDSILNQTFTDFEFIIICDNPSYAEGLALLHSYAEKDNRIVIIENEKNLGLTKSLNKGISVAKGDYIARMDADDISMPERLYLQVNYMEEHPKTDVCHTAYVKINEKGMIKNKVILNKLESSIGYLIIQDVIAHPTVFFNKKILMLRNPLYNEKYKSAQDYELWSFLMLEGIIIGYIDSVQLKYRESSEQISKKSSEIQKNNGKRIRKQLLFNYLNKDIEKNVDFQSEQLLRKAKQIVPSSETEKTIIYCIKYILYYNLATHSLLYSFNYLIDKDVLIMKFPARMSIYVLFARVGNKRWRILNL